jgi:hypothetical protein
MFAAIGATLLPDSQKDNKTGREIDQCLHHF